MSLIAQQSDDDREKSEGFWREFFLLKPDRASLRRILDALPPGDLLHLEPQTRQLFARSVAALRDSQGAADLHALDVRILRGEAICSFPPRDVTSG